MEDSIGQRIPPWLAPAAITLGLACIIVGFGLLTWTPGSSSGALAGTGDTTLLPAAPLPTLVLMVTSGPTPVSSPTAAPLPTLALMVTSGPTPVSSPTAAPSSTMFPAVSLAETDATFTLTIVHSNDTWGYTRPCG
jgi:hypothetical protein